MFRQANAFKQALRDRVPQVGCFLSLGSPTSTEIVAGAGFDWVLIDMEHAPNEVPDVLQHLRAVGTSGCEPVVRVPWNEPVIVKRVLDIGARSLLFPYISSADEARAAVQATRYPPEGFRGYAGGTRATGYGRIRDYARESARQTCVLVQVESPQALQAIPEIAAVEGVDGIFIGPNDLATNMGHLGDVAAAPVREAIDAALAAIDRAGLPSGILSLDDNASRSYFGKGCVFVGVSSDGFILARQTERIVREFASLRAAP